ncbi:MULTISPECIES: glucosylglycerol 3-phosphatase [unclassified Synechocystis]|uniref:glucosylglycerol 3-phosphatase n=1 Tax=unclassified Synechocystis TaxID=2640012 RepID=UPI000409F935|nr:MULTISPECIES: glucosylglycerol 3-phosphatase [unclassified Synechocystis]AIE73611.1 Glucosylglycerol-phosphate phosphatase [Synechocystis sp. PCC 6714]MCT0254973.1 glucosylglycerol 3-phosphatase [Synechocystis sp. CS-94]
MVLHQKHLSLDHGAFCHTLAQTENLLIVQDLDGVCMELVQDPLNRRLDADYVRATRLFAGHFYVLTNGEHVGKRGVQGIVERAFGDVSFVQREGLYLPGLAAGGVQWQDRHGNVGHPGVGPVELEFLAAVPKKITNCLKTFFGDRLHPLSPEQLQMGIEASVLDNVASPTANLNTLANLLQDVPHVYRDLQATIAQLLDELITEAEQQGLANSFFIHYAPNLGRDENGKEIVRWAKVGDSGTTDFQFMLRGGVKEAGVLALLNRYYHSRTGEYPLGESFSARQAPPSHQDLLHLVKTKFDPDLMPLIIGVGDTVTSQVDEATGEIRRGGSDRQFLQLIQDLGDLGNHGNLVVYVDSSRGEVKNRQPLQLETVAGQTQVVAGPGDMRDTEEPLKINVAFPGGYEQYVTVFKQAAQRRRAYFYRLQNSY